ncbi:SctK family type III secretion system sorting platform protein [Pandoraea commovens]|uniref:Uncharacterized protein n=1 Tax=Pandoraea commovens TaxID=2508289 RepID=A0A5E4W8M8_9BURK|nr:SctK family type III secretion system sorting platform protein [Pandoraea commovens]VVE20229.1 hypothetical protein PCO31010_03121 [Pandoraea commovens]
MVKINAEVKPGDQEIALGWYFNTLPSRYLHASWRRRFLDAPWCDVVFDSPYGHGALSLSVLRKIGMETCFWTDWNRPETTIALQTRSSDLIELSRWIGQILLSRHVRRSIDYESRCQWQAALGEEKFLSLHAQAPLLTHERLETLIDSAPITPANFNAVALATGTDLLINAIARLPAPLGKRLLLKLPCPDSSAGGPLRHTPPEIEIWPWILRMWHRLPMQASA